MARYKGCIETNGVVQMRKTLDIVTITLAVVGVIAMIPAIAHDLHLCGF